MYIVLCGDKIVGHTLDKSKFEGRMGYKCIKSEEISLKMMHVAQKNVVTGTEYWSSYVTHQESASWKHEGQSVIGFGSTPEEALENRKKAEESLLKLSVSIVETLSMRYVAYATHAGGVYKVDRVNGTAPLPDPGEIQGFGRTAGEAVKDAERQVVGG